MKGREKRMANLEKKRLEKEEAKMVLATPPKKPRLKRQTNKIKDEPISVSVPDPVPTPVVETKPDPQTETEAITTNDDTTVVQEEKKETPPATSTSIEALPDAIADRIWEALAKKYDERQADNPPPPPKVSKPRTKRPTSTSEPAKPRNPLMRTDTIQKPRVNNFTWM